MKEQFTDSAIIQMLSSHKELDENRVFAYLFKTYKKELQRFLLNSGLPSMDDAEEIFHDALITLRAKACTGTFDLGQSNAIKSYLYAVCRNLAKRKWRTVYKDKDLVENVAPEETEESILGKLMETDRKEFFIQLLSTIGEKCKEILHRRFYLKHKHEDIAEDLGYASAQVSRNKTFACIRKLKTTMQSMDGWKTRLYP